MVATESLQDDKGKKNVRCNAYLNVCEAESSNPAFFKAKQDAKRNVNADAEETGLNISDENITASTAALSACHEQVVEGWTIQ